MWTTLSVSRWMFLLILTVVMFISASQVDSYNSNIGLPCCNKGSQGGVRFIKECYEQKPRWQCNHHAYLIIDKNGRQKCIDPSSKWLKDRIKKGLKCDPDLTY